MADNEITRITTPVRLTYQITAGAQQTQFLHALTERRIVGVRFDGQNQVYVPARGMCPTNGEAPSALVDVAQTGTLTTYCVINIPFEGQRLQPPYVCGAILLDGADLPLFHIIAGVSPADVRMGMRVRAVWVDDAELGPTLESIRYFEPTGEPDAAYETYAEHL